MRLRPIAIGEVFSWTDPDTGETIDFDATSARRWAEANPELVEFHEAPIDDQFREFAQFVMQNRGIVEYRLKRLCEPYLSEPTLSVLMPDFATLTIDGHHRVVRWYLDGRATWKSIRIPLGYWERFVISRKPGITG